MDVKSMLLGFLMQGDMTGYELRKAFSLSFSFFTTLSYGSIYPALKKMEREGLVAMRTEIQDGAPNRKVYSITEEGKRIFLEALREPLHYEEKRSPFLTKLFFFAHLSPEERTAATRTYMDSVRQAAAELEAARPEIELHADHWQFLCFRFGVKFFEDLAGRLSDVLAELEEPEKKDGRREE